MTSTHDPLHLLRLDAPGAGAALAPDAVPGCRLTPDANGRDVLLEREASFDGILSVDGAVVYEVAHVRPGQVIASGDARFVLLAPYAVFVRATDDEDARLVRRRDLAQRFPHAGWTTSAPAVVTGTSSLRWHRIVSVASVVLGLTATGLSALRTRDVSPAAPAVEVSTPPPVEAAPPAPPAAAAAPSAPSPSPPPETVPSAAPAPVSRPTPVAAEKTATKEAASVGDPKNAPDVRAAVARLLLEANYDPDRVRHDLNKLRLSVPKGSPVEREVAQAIGSLP